MLKKTLSLIFSIIAILTFSSCAGRNNEIFSVENGTQYMVVRDADGNIVINDSYKLQVYTLNENGKKQKSDTGEYITEYIDFNGQIVLEETVETAEMRFKIPKSFSDNADIPGYFYSELYDSEIYFTYYDEKADNHIEAAEQNCESLLESFGSEAFLYEKYTVVINNSECVAFKLACTSSEYYKNSFQYYIPYDTGFYVINCVIDTDNAKKVNFDRFVEAIYFK